MTHHSSRAQWNTANARLANKPFDDLFEDKKPMNIIEWIVAEKYAKNEFAASHIANGLKLSELHGDLEAQQARVKLYRAWRDSQVFGKDTAACYAKAIAGERVPELALLAEAVSE